MVRAALAAMNTTWGGDSEYFGMLVMLPDMPGIEASDIVEMDRVFRAQGGPVVRATTEDGRAGHPVLFPAHAVRDFETLSGDKGAAAMMEGERVEFVALPGRRAVQLCAAVLRGSLPGLPEAGRQGRRPRQGR